MGTLILLLCLIVLGALPASAADSLKDVFEQQARLYEKMYKERNAAALAEGWTVDGTFLNCDGKRYQGRKAIETFFQSAFADGDDLPLKINISSVSAIADGSTAIEEGTTAVGDTTTPVTQYTAVHVKENGEWKVAWVEERQMAPSYSLDDLAWLCGTWRPSNIPNPPATFTVEKVQDGKFLQGTTSDKLVRQIIGIDPSSRKVVSWHFDSQGGFGTGQWEKSADGWKQVAKGVLPDGTTCSATYSIVPLSHDSFLFQSSGRYAGPIELPDTGAIKLERVKSE